MSHRDIPANAPVSLRSLLWPGLQAIRLYWRAIVVLQATALVLVLGYFHVALVREFCEYLARLRQDWGMIQPVVGTIIAGVVLPELAKLLLPRAHRQTLTPGEVLITAVFFAGAGAGAFVDAQYRLLSVLLGDDTGMGTAISKMLMDQFLMTPLYGAPYWILVYAWKANHFRILPTLRPLGRHWYLTKVLPLLIPAWAYWIPMTLMIFSLPADLQLSLFVFAMAAWSLVMVFIAQTEAKQASLPTI
jgi:hypothetical protein